ncbi:hypothetical protein [Pedobacter aquatilis]|uniref:hypothetical protein n=1 Tax=Pedobacter aquatilis TaxID=351343 RepID=UPI00292D6B97|nr:hypothetical protein [Pedobacter aquatilis]
MKRIILIIGFAFLILSLHAQKDARTKIAVNKKTKTQQANLFSLREIKSENIIKIIPPKNSNFKLPDSSAKIQSIKRSDFNADGKIDLLVYLGACGTGGCMYGLFLNQHNNYYKLAFMNYLKNAKFKKEKNGLLSIHSSEETEAYDPSKLQITKYKFNKNKYQYEVDTTFLYIDK